MNEFNCCESTQFSKVHPFHLFLVFDDSHELRTPMACIIGLLDMLLSEKLLDEIASSVRQIHRCATSLVAILNSALDIAKVCMQSVSFVK